MIDSPRIEWDAFDLKYKGKRIEVKSAAYLQSWEQKNLSIISFDISKKMSWYAESNTHNSEPSRVADVYVFCLFAEKNLEEANVLDLAKWKFWIIPTDRINSEFGAQKTVSLSRIEKISNPVMYSDIKSKVTELLYG